MTDFDKAYIKEPKRANFFPRQGYIETHLPLKVGNILKIGEEKTEFVVKKVIPLENGLYKCEFEEAQIIHINYGKVEND